MKLIDLSLNNAINDLMKEESLKDFHLGGGTNLALKHNHRVSTDIDLFSSGIVGLEKIKSIFEKLNKDYKGSDLKFKNNSDQQLSFITGLLNYKGEPIKVDIIQNIGLLHPIENRNGKRLINDLDIGPLKLISAASRGTQKDFYDLHILSEIFGLKKIYNELNNRVSLLDTTKVENQNIFNLTEKGIDKTLVKNLTPLADFNNSKDRKNSGNRLHLNKKHPHFAIWPTVQKKWAQKVENFAKENNLIFEITPLKRINRSSKNNGFTFDI